MTKKIVQSGIDGIADDKVITKYERRQNKKIVRPKLDDFIRNKLGMTRDTFAKLLDFGPSQITRWLYGETTPNGRMMAKLARDLSMTMDEVYDLFMLER